MAIPVEMPKMSDTMEEGVVVAWLVDEGDEISAGDVIAQVETDKATMDLEVYDDGVLLKQVIAEGDAVPIGGLIAVLGKAGEDISVILSGYETGAAAAPSPGGSVAAGADDTTGEPTSTGEPASAGEPASTDVHTSSQADPARSVPGATPAVQSAADANRIKSSPLARKLAAGHGIDLSTVRGTGPEGRIIKRDIQVLVEGARISPGASSTAPVHQPVQPSIPSLSRKAIPPSPGEASAVSAVPDTIAPGSVAQGTPPPGKSAPAPLSSGGYESVRLSQMRKAISRRLSESKYTSPHFYLTADIAMENAVAARVRINELTEEQGLDRISFNDLVTKACALALRAHPWVNASYLETEGEIRLHNDIHVAVAVAVDEGLITPVIWNADQKGLARIASETRVLAEKARTKQLQPEEYTGSTFTTSNLGMFGVDEFTAIINPPNACILAIGGIRDTPVVRNGEIVPGKRMKVTLSCDHRVVDGATGARYLATVKKYLEDPLSMLL